MQDAGAEMLQMQLDVVLVRAAAASLVDLDGHGAADHVAAGEILGIRRIALHEALALRVGEIAALAARAFGDQAAGTIDAARMKLRELHVLQRQAGPQRHRVAIAGAGMRGRAGEINAAIATGRQHGSVRTEAMQRTVVEIPGQQAAAGAIVVHQKIKREIFDEELGAVLHALLVERVQDGMPSAIGRGAGALRHVLAITNGLAAERTLVDLALGGTREGHAEVFQLQHRGYRLPAHVFYRVLVTEPVGTLDRVVHVEAPVVAVPHIAERSRHAALRRHGVAAGRKNLADASGPQARRSHTERGAHACPAGPDDDDVVGVIDDFIRFGHRFIPGGVASGFQSNPSTMRT